MIKLANGGHRTSLQRGALFAVGATIITGIAVGQAATEVRIGTNDPRPLAQAAADLERVIGRPINYEDIRYENSGDISDVTASVIGPEQRAAHPGARIFVPRGGELSVAVQVGPHSSVADDLQAISVLANANTAEGLPGVYAASFADGAFFITPAQLRDSEGSLVPASSVLATPIEMPLEERTAADTLALILQKVSTASGFNVDLGTFPMNGMIATNVMVGAANEPARDVIERLFSAVLSRKLADGTSAPGISYQLFFGPVEKQYAFNAHVVPSDNLGLGAQSGLQGSVPATPSKNPYVVIK